MDTITSLSPSLHQLMKGKNEYQLKIFIEFSTLIRLPLATISKITCECFAYVGRLMVSGNKCAVQPSIAGDVIPK